MFCLQIIIICLDFSQPGVLCFHYISKTIIIIILLLSPEKPGECPAESDFKCDSNSGILSKAECESDFDCYGAGKCCKKCGVSVCILPVDGKS
jgi:WAP-type (Whey Acidic Protein) ''four-disulfide core''.